MAYRAWCGELCLHRRGSRGALCLGGSRCSFKGWVSWGNPRHLSGLTGVWGSVWSDASNLSDKHTDTGFFCMWKVKNVWPHVVPEKTSTPGFISFVSCSERHERIYELPSWNVQTPKGKGAWLVLFKYLYEAIENNLGSYITFLCEGLVISSNPTLTYLAHDYWCSKRGGALFIWGLMDVDFLKIWFYGK